MQAAAGAPARLSGRVRHSHPFALSSVTPSARLGKVPVNRRPGFPNPSFPRRREPIPGAWEQLYHFVLTTPLIEHDAVQQSVISALSRNPVPGGCTQTGWLWASRVPLSAHIWRHHSELVLLESLALLSFSKGRRARQSCRIPAPAWPTLGGSWSACHAGRCAAAGTPRAGASAPTSRAA